MVKNKGGRPPIDIDFNVVDKLCELHCTGAEIAGFLEIHYETLNNKIKDQLKPDGTHYSGFPEYFAVKCSRGKVTLRRMQWSSANKGNVAMQIFLGKNLLNQTEKQTIDMTTETVIQVSLEDTKAENDSEEQEPDEGADDEQ